MHPGHASGACIRGIAQGMSTNARQVLSSLHKIRHLSTGKHCGHNIRHVLGHTLGHPRAFWSSGPRRQAEWEFHPGDRELHASEWESHPSEWESHPGEWE